MLHALLTFVLATFWFAAPLRPDDTSKEKGDATKKEEKQSLDDNTKKEKKLPSAKRRVGRPGDLTQAEEDRLDQILDAFIAHDIGLRPNPRVVAALQAMGHEAIPALIRALNKSAMMSDSCPVSMFHRKLISLLSTSDDEEVLRIARTMIGSGVRRTPYEGLLNHLRVVASQRQAYLARTRMQQDSRQKGASGSNNSRYSREDR